MLAMFALVTSLILTTLTTATPLPPSSQSLHPRAGDALTQLLSIAPTSTTCTSAPFPAECATATQALPAILSSFGRYAITTAAEQAALLSWMAFESADFKYNVNHYPGTPGQGTRCMLSPAYVAKYVASLPELAGKASADPAKVLALVEGDGYSFGSAAWFLSSQCGSVVREGLAGGSEAGWEGWITGCVGTTVTDARREYWQRAVKALGVPSNG